MEIKRYTPANGSEMMESEVGDWVLEDELERYKKAVEKAQSYLSLISMASGSHKISDIADNGINELNSILNP